MVTENIHLPSMNLYCILYDDNNVFLAQFSHTLVAKTICKLISEIWRESQQREFLNKFAPAVSEW